MNLDDLKSIIRGVIRKQSIVPTSDTTDDIEYEEIARFPELKETLISLLSDEYDVFISSVDWVSPKPTTFRINLKNNHFFYLEYGTRSWIATVEGKKYYLSNLPEETRATEAISRILKYTTQPEISEENDGFTNDEPSPGGGSSSGGGASFDADTVEEPPTEEPPAEEVPAEA